MTAKQVFDYALVELNKREAPSLLLEDYNYFINKAVNQYINRMYNMYDANQQKTDDLRVLKSTAILTPTLNNDYIGSDLFSTVYEAELPDDYLHILGCTVEYLVKKDYRCFNAGDFWQQGASRITGDMFPQLINNYYLRPTYKRPYYYINNVNVNSTFPTSDTQVPVLDTKFHITLGDGILFSDMLVISSPELFVTVFEYGSAFTTIGSLYDELLNRGLSAMLNDSEIILSLDNTLFKGGTVTGVEGKIIVTTTTASPIEKSANLRYGNKSKVRMEIRYGKDNKTFELKKVYVDYLKAPQFIRLTQDQVDVVEDTTQILEYPDYVCQEIVNELIKLLMENASDPRLQSHIPINQSIANPAQEQPQQRK